jgi:hypothetical protein
MKKLTTLFWAASTAIAIGAALAPAALAGGAVPSLSEGDLASGPFSKMHMLLEKTILNVDVVTVDVRVNAKAQGEFSKIASGKKIEGDVEEQLAKAAIAVDNAVVQMKFERDVSLSQWLDQVEGSLEKAVSAGYIAGARKTQVMTNLPTWFAPIKDRGFKEGDKVLYRVSPGSLRTVLHTMEGQTVVDQTDNGDASKILFSGYFAPGADMRAMLRSLPNAK